jgi:hypothetical protein
MYVKIIVMAVEHEAPSSPENLSDWKKAVQFGVRVLYLAMQDENFDDLLAIARGAWEPYGYTVQDYRQTQPQDRTRFTTILGRLQTIEPVGLPDGQHLDAKARATLNTELNASKHGIKVVKNWMTGFHRLDAPVSYIAQHALNQGTILALSKVSPEQQSRFAELTHLFSPTTGSKLRSAHTMEVDRDTHEIYVASRLGSLAYRGLPLRPESVPTLQAVPYLKLIHFNNVALLHPPAPPSTT